MTEHTNRSVATPPLARRLLAETVGTGGLVATVIGSGIAAAKLSPSDTGLELLENALATAAGLAILIVLFGPVSGAHFNPVVTLTDVVTRKLPWLEGVAFVVAQVVGGTLGAVVANLMFGLAPVSVSTHDRFSVALWFSEIVATCGLLFVIIVLVRSGRAGLAGPMVGAYIGCAYFFTASTSFANPAVTIARMFSDTFAGIAPGSVVPFILAQLIGAALGVLLATTLYPAPPADPADSAAPAGSLAAAQTTTTKG